MKFRGYMFEVTDASGRLVWRTFIGVSTRRPDTVARERIRELRAAVLGAHAPGKRHVTVTRFNQDTFPAGALDYDDSHWWDRLHSWERAALDSGLRGIRR